MQPVRGSRFLAEFLHAYGITHVFFVPAILMETLAEMEGMPIRRVVTHGEKAAAYMADGYARVSRRPGVCMAQHIGASNLAAGLRDPFLACSPVLAITGGGTSQSRYRHAYQELDDMGQFDRTTKFNARIDDVRRLPDLMRQAFREATTGSPGPVHLQMQGHFAQITEQDADLDATTEQRFSAAPAYRSPADPALVDKALHQLRQAERPIIVAGGGLTWSDASEVLVKFAEAMSIPVTTSLNARGVIPDNHPLAVGLVGGYPQACANEAVAKADLVFFAGSHTGGQVTGNWKYPRPGTAVIQLDIEPREIGRNYPCSPLLGDARTVLQQMLDRADGAPVPPRTAWLDVVSGLVSHWRKSVLARRTSSDTPIRPERLCHDISQRLPAGAIVVCDTGHSGIWAGTMIEFDKPGLRLIRSAGSLGWAFPAALGVKCAAPDRTVICFAGDGAFYYHLVELETAARHGINVVVVVNNNSALSQEIPLYEAGYRQLPRIRDRELWGFEPVDFARIAEGFGCRGIRVEEPDEIGPALERGLAAQRPVVIDVVTDHRIMGELGF